MLNGMDRLELDLDHLSNAAHSEEKCTKRIDTIAITDEKSLALTSTTAVQAVQSLTYFQLTK